MRVPARTPCFLALAFLAACGGSSPTGPGDVPEPDHSSLTLTPPTGPFTIVGATARLTVTATDSSGATLTSPSIRWGWSGSGAVRVDASGLVTATRWGSGYITAELGSHKDSVEMRVELSGPVGSQLTGSIRTCDAGAIGPFPCSGMNLLAYIPNSGLGVPTNRNVNDLWGWTDPVTGKEYALICRDDGMTFVDLSTPTEPVIVGFLPFTAGAKASTWRDVKVYNDHAFIVSDGAGAHGMQVFALTQLRKFSGTPLTFSPATIYRGVASVHNIVINEATGFGYLVGSNSGGTTCGGGLHMVDLRSPTLPVFAGCFSDPITGRSHTGYTHDAQCVVYQGPDLQYRGHEICFGLNETHVSIADVTVKSAPVALARATYPGVAYTHQGWLSEDSRYLFVDDELDETNHLVSGTRTLIWDVAVLNDPILVGQYIGPTAATDHNLYVRGNRVFASNYQFGIRVLSILNPLQPSELGYFDTAPEFANVAGFGGSWSNYPYFASGIIVVTSRAEGMFVLKMP